MWLEQRTSNFVLPPLEDKIKPTWFSLKLFDETSVNIITNAFIIAVIRSEKINYSDFCQDNNKNIPLSEYSISLQEKSLSFYTT